MARRPHEPDFAAFAKFPHRDGLFLDVGANVGQSALSFRLFRDSPILSIEANRFHASDLRFLKRTLLLRNFDFLICAAGEESGEAILKIPTLRGVPLTGTASLISEVVETDDWLREHLGVRDPDEFRIVEQRVEVRRLDDFELAPSFVKIDVEGYELPVVRGLLETLERHRPVLLVERTAGAHGLGDELFRLGYEPFVYRPSADDFEPYKEQQAQNLFYLPADNGFPQDEPSRRLPGAV